MCWEALDSSISGISNFASDVGTGISNFASNAGSNFADIGSGIVDAAKGAGDSIGSLFANSGGAFSNSFDPTAYSFPSDAASIGATNLEASAAPAASGAGGFDSWLKNLNDGYGLTDGNSGTQTVANSFRDSADKFYGMAPEEAVRIAEAAKTGTGLSDGISTIGDVLKKNSNWLLPAGMLGATALKSNQQLPGFNDLKNSAATLRGNAQPLLDPLTKGTALPSGAEAGLAQAQASMEAGIRSQYAKMGLAGSTMERQALAQVPQQIQQQKFQMAQGLYQQGLQTLGLADQDTSRIMQIQLSQDQELTNALARIAAATASVGVKDFLK